MFGLFGLRAQLLQELFFALDRHVFRRKVVRDINPEAMFRQILDMPNGCLHRKARPQIFFDCSGFCGDSTMINDFAMALSPSLVSEDAA